MIPARAARLGSISFGQDLGFGDRQQFVHLGTQRGDVDVVLELVGGSDGPALTLARAALDAGKGFVTANKAMIAHHGLALAEQAALRGAPLKFEAAVAGGIPVVKGLREGAAANRIERIYGILNGTCNYILSEMERTGADFGEMLQAAQDKGYAEADPTFDIDGIDAAHKLAILAAIGFGARVDFDAVAATGIREVRAADITQAGALDYVIRLVSIASLDESDGARRLLQRVRPCLVARGHPLAAVTGPTNAVVAEGNFSGRLLFQGAGAGAGRRAPRRRRPRHHPRRRRRPRPRRPRQTRRRPRRPRRRSPHRWPQPTSKTCGVSTTTSSGMRAATPL